MYSGKCNLLVYVGEGYVLGPVFGPLEVSAIGVGRVAWCGARVGGNGSG